MKAIDESDFEIESDGVTVWVNTTHGHCVGRFGRNGIDIHRPIAEQETHGQCLECSHRVTTLEDWDGFKAAMFHHFKVVVSNSHTPVRFLETAKQRRQAWRKYYVKPVAK